jgi:hypothetical protein
MSKLIKDGQVAVAVSYGFGAGWSTWNDVAADDSRFTTLFVEGKHDEAFELVEKLDLGFGAGAHQVEIEWLDVGTEYMIEEYDGSELLVTKEDRGDMWIVA